MTFFTPTNLKSVCGGTWIARATGAPAPNLAGVCIDSRQVRPGHVFIAIRGDTHDGHAFVADALNKGAGMAIVDSEAALDAPPAVAGAWRQVAAANHADILLVPDARKALLRLAAAYRKVLASTRIIAVTGSAGKTTTVRLIDAMLSGSLRGRANIKSFNNDIGVPLTLLSADPGDQYLVCEIGTSAPGEIGRLAAIADPDVAVITCIGRAHLEGLGSIEGVAREKASLLTHLRPGGLAVAPADGGGGAQAAAACILADVLRCVPQVVTFGRSDEADLRLTRFDHVLADDALRARFEVNGRSTFQSPLIGEHNALNALAAIAVARRFGVADDAIAAALTAFSSPEMRLQRLQVGGVSVLNDAYNANPESTAAALRALSGIDAAGDGRRIAILGDMLELGEHAPSAHREVAELILALGNIDMVVAVGHHMLNAAERLMRDWPHERCEIISDLTPQQARRIAGLLRPGDTVLIKGSRRMRLERIVEAINAAPPATASSSASARRRSA